MIPFRPESRPPNAHCRDASGHSARSLSRSGRTSFDPARRDVRKRITITPLLVPWFGTIRWLRLRGHMQRREFIGLATIRILSTHAVQEVLGELGPPFERVSGVGLAIDYDPANALKRAIEAGMPFDVAIVTRTVIDE